MAPSPPCETLFPRRPPPRHPRLRFAALLLLLTVHLSLLTSAPPRASAAVPFLLNYQGRVTVTTGTPPVTVAFSGFGQFRFALVDASGTTTYWSNDGTSVGGSQPTNGVLLSVPASANGTASVLLGDTSISGMTVTIPAAVFTTHADVRLRVWFDDGNNGVQRLAPDQRVAAAGYAAVAGTVPDGAITGAKIAAGTITNANVAAGTITGTSVAAGGLTGVNLANGAVGSAQLASGAVGSTQLAAGAALASLQAAGQSGVPGGGVILSREPNSAALAAAGYVRIGAMNPTPDRWDEYFPNNVPKSRISFSSIWSGTEMIVWGGEDVTGTHQLLSGGGRYNPTTNTWRLLPTAGEPSLREAHTAVWTGTEMIIWGGLVYPSTYPLTGARYNPTTDSWFATDASTAPVGRYGHSAVWTGSEMIIWGGENSTPGDLNDGARYSPIANSWRTLPAVGAPTNRAIHTAVWTGSRMIVWGGRRNSPLFYDSKGGSYDPVVDAWASAAQAPNLVNGTNSPQSRQRGAAVWTGTELIVWGGFYETPTVVLLGNGGAL